MKYTICVEVALNIPFSNGVLTYLWEEEKDPIIGQRVQVPLRGKTLKGVIYQIKKNLELPYSLKKIIRVYEEEPIIGINSFYMADWIHRFCLISLGEAFSFILPWALKEKPLEKEKISFSVPDTISLNFEQKKVQQEILEAKYPSSFYLQGITGSGKSEVMVQTAKKFLEKGESVLYLVPEITLAFALRISLEKSLKGYPLFTYHSSLSDSQKLNQWNSIKNSPACCVIGVRSACFVPFHNLGLIIMDEEQEATYKSEASPRFYTKHIIFQLQKFFKSKIVLTSATPSLESYYAMREGLLKTLTLSERVGIAKQPEVEVVPLTNSQDWITPQLTEAILKNFQEGKQAILFLNKRGFMSFFHCPECSYQKTCPHCSISLTFHKKKYELKCHYCDYKEKVPPQGVSCPDCGFFPLIYSKVGTEFIEETLKYKFPHIKTIRLDTDISAESRKKTQEVLLDFEKGNYDVLLGTQMIAKGLNFPKVELVGILYADSALSLPDFRAYEKTYALIRQVIGRSGRFSQEGKVILQALNPNHPLIILAKEGKDNLFYEEELSIRKSINFPPFSYLFRLVIRGALPEIVQRESEKLVKLLNKKNLSTSTLIYEASPCVIEKIAGNWRWQILIKGEKISNLHYLASQAKEEWNKLGIKNLYLEVDPYPMNML